MKEKSVLRKTVQFYSASKTLLYNCTFWSLAWPHIHQSSEVSVPGVEGGVNECVFPHCFPLILVICLNPGLVKWNFELWRRFLKDVKQKADNQIRRIWTWLVIKAFWSALLQLPHRNVFYISPSAPVPRARRLNRCLNLPLENEILNMQVTFNRNILLLKENELQCISSHPLFETHLWRVKLNFELETQNCFLNMYSKSPFKLFSVQASRLFLWAVKEHRHFNH